MAWERIRKLLSSRDADRIASVVIWVCVCMVGLAALHFGRRVLVCDQFVIRGVSMTPTFASGQRVWVRKYLMGPRIYTRFKFEEGEPLRCIRLPGFRRLRAGDIAVFNSPEGWENSHAVTFQVNYVYAKRCLGVPGDTVGAQKGHYYSTGADPVGIPVKQEAVLRATPDSSLTGRGLEAGQFAGLHGQWTIRDFGPLVVPEKGMTVPLDSMGVRLYAKSICYETGTRPEWSQGQAWLNGRALSEYTFQKNWYFFVGDHIVDSRDSRYLGFVPEEFVVGIVAEGR